MSGTDPRPSGRRRAMLYAGAGAAALAGGALAWRALAPGEAPGPAGILFAQRLPSIDGDEVAFAQWRGRHMVLNFWATWCPPCVEEMPELDALQQEFGDAVRFVGIGIDSAANMQAFVRKVPVRYPLLVAGNVGSEMAREFGNASGGLPFTVVLDEKGAVTYRYAGRLDIAVLRERLAGQLARA